MDTLEQLVRRINKNEIVYGRGDDTPFQYYTCIRDDTKDRKWHCVDGFIDEAWHMRPIPGIHVDEIRHLHWLPPTLIHPHRIFHRYDEMAARLRLNQTANKTN